MEREYTAGDVELSSNWGDTFEEAKRADSENKIYIHLQLNHSPYTASTTLTVDEAEELALHLFKIVDFLREPSGEETWEL